MSAWPSADPEVLDNLPMSFPIGDLLPQAGSMVLLERLLEVGENHALAEVMVRDDGLFSVPGGLVPSWVGMEYMAQTVAAYSGYWRRRRGLDIDLGFLLGTRHFTSSASAFECGQRLRVRADKLMEGGNDMSVFACTLQGDKVRAECLLNVFLPRDSRTFLEGRRP